MKINFLISFFCLLLFVSCSKKEKKVLTDWDKAAQFVKYHSSSNYLVNKDKVFFSTSKEKKASEWAEYFFSIYSTRNWIYANDEYAEYIREPKIPVGIRLINSTYNEELKGSQLVISADDSKTQIIVEGFVNSNKKVFTENWKFPFKN